jgi:hypothetical protein
VLGRSLVGFANTLFSHPVALTCQAMLRKKSVEQAITICGTLNKSLLACVFPVAEAEE